MAAKIRETTYGNHIHMVMKLNGRIEEVDNYCGLDNTWNHFQTTGDADETRRAEIINAFKELY